MFMPDNPGLIRDFQLDMGRILQDNTLTAKPGIEPWIDCPVNEILLLVGDFFQVIFAMKDVHMAGAARTDPPAIMVQMDVVCFGDFQKGGTCLHIFDYDGLCNRFVFKVKFNSGHGCFFAAIFLSRFFANNKPPFWFRVVPF